MQQAFQKSVQEHGALKINLAHYLPFGPPGVGKTCVLRRLVDKYPLGDPATIEQPFGNSYSTDALEIEKPIRVTVPVGLHYEPKAVVTWSEVENVKEETAILVKTLANRFNSLHSHSHPNLSVFANEPSKKVELAGEHPLSVEMETVTHTTNSLVSNLTMKAVENRNMDDVQELLDDSMTLYCTDTGGQPEFQEVLPALISGPLIFLFIFNLFTGLDSKYDVTFRTPGQQFQSFTSSFTVKQVLMQFLTSIASYHMFISRSLTQQTSIPPPSVIVIGTHRDLVSDEEFSMIDKKLWQVFEATSFASLQKNIIVPLTIIS